MKKYILNNELVDSDKAYVHVHDLALLRGYGVFDFFRLDGSVPMFIDEHIDRFYTSATKLRITPQITKTDLKNKIIKMLQHNKMANSGVRMVVTGGESPNGYDIGAPTLFVINEPIKSDPKANRAEGIKLTMKEYLRNIPEAKTINYIMGIYELPNVQEKQALDTIYCYEGKILELTRANFFIVNQQNQIITAKNNVLLGINRNKLLEACANDFEIQERDLLVEELQTAREAFITGTNKRIIPVIAIDDLVIGSGKPGSQVEKIQRLYDAFIDEYIGQSTALF